VAQIPDDRSRWRCAHCGNLTRFDIVRSTRAREFWHMDMAGEPVVDEREVLAETIESVTCRWCGSGDRVEIVARPEFGGPSQEGPGDGGP
jgi:RNase P subunit RPR2